jgi:hypothetical protein
MSFDISEESAGEIINSSVMKVNDYLLSRLEGYNLN